MTGTKGAERRRAVAPKENPDRESLRRGLSRLGIGRRGALSVNSYLKYLQALDRRLLKLLARYGAQTDRELLAGFEEAWLIRRLPRGAREIIPQAVRDWLESARRRDLVRRCPLDDRPGLAEWVLTDRGQLRARGPIGRALTGGPKPADGFKALLAAGAFVVSGKLSGFLTEHNKLSHDLPSIVVGVALLVGYGLLVWWLSLYVGLLLTLTIRASGLAPSLAR